MTLPSGGSDRQLPSEGSRRGRARWRGPASWAGAGRARTGAGERAGGLGERGGGGGDGGGVGWTLAQAGEYGAPRRPVRVGAPWSSTGEGNGRSEGRARARGPACCCEGGDGRTGRLQAHRRGAIAGSRKAVQRAAARSSSQRRRPAVSGRPAASPRPFADRLSCIPSSGPAQLPSLSPVAATLSRRSWPNKSHTRRALAAEARADTVALLAAVCPGRCNSQAATRSRPDKHKYTSTSIQVPAPSTAVNEGLVRLHPHPRTGGHGHVERWTVIVTSAIARPKPGRHRAARAVRDGHILVASCCPDPPLLCSPFAPQSARRRLFGKGSALSPH